MSDSADIQQAMASNRRRWDERTPVHAKSRLYNLEGFKAGATSLHSVELEEMADSPNALAGQFDIVFTSHGVLVWLPDLKRWAEAITHFLKPGGFFYVVDHHPFGHVFYDEEDVTDLRPC